MQFVVQICSGFEQTEKFLFLLSYRQKNAVHHILQCLFFQIL